MLLKLLYFGRIVELIHPSQNHQIRSRNELLQATMRPPDVSFAIDLEYPIVLSPEHSDYSWCMMHDDQVIAHLNLWPRFLVAPQHGNEIPVGLIGNVATKESWQGRGVMRQLIEQVVKIANDQGLKGLILWSDLLKFYQNLGFTSGGSEYRITIASEALAKYRQSALKRRDPSQYDDKFLAKILATRVDTKPTLKRSIKEFRNLLAIPDTHLFTPDDPELGYAICGKGCDMIGVIHEWSDGGNRALLPTICADVASELQLPEVMLLSPYKDATESFSQVSGNQKVVQECTTALTYIISDNVAEKKLIESSFIWGLDSI